MHYLCYVYLANKLSLSLSGTTRVSRYQKGKTNLDFIGARDSEWQWHQLGHTQVCSSLQTVYHASNPTTQFLQAGCPSCHPANSVNALKANICRLIYKLAQSATNQVVSIITSTQKITQMNLMYEHYKSHSDGFSHCSSVACACTKH